MAYDGRIMQRALARFDEDKQRRSAQLDQRRRALYAREPRLAEIETELRGTMSRIISSALARGTDPLPAIRVLRDENLALQQERTQLLAAMGYPADYLEEKPACRLCGDTGYANGRVCGCLRAYYAREQLAELSRLLPLGEDSFETFSFDWYGSAVQPAFGVSPRANMERNFDVCRDYAYQFAKGGGSLLLSGGTGLGKTFLSACIARVVSENGFSVVYDTAASVFARFEDAKFRREGRGPLHALRPADFGRSGYRDDHLLRPERPVPDRQRAADGKALHHHQHQSGAGGDRQPLRPVRAVPSGGGVRDPALLRRGHPAAEAGAAVI